MLFRSIKFLFSNFMQKKKISPCVPVSTALIVDATTLKCLEFLTHNNELECLVIKIMKAIDIKVEDCDVEVCHKTDKSKWNSKKAILGFCNRKFSKSACYNNKRLVSVNTSAVDLSNITKFIISKNLTDCNNKLAFKWQTLNRASFIQSI